jgi:hypothetical protein
MPANPLFCATLRPASERYAQWREILGSVDVAIMSPIPSLCMLGTQEAQVYNLRIAALTEEQLTRLVAFIAHKFSAAPETVRAALPAEGFPIRAEDVTVAISLRAFP